MNKQEVISKLKSAIPKNKTDDYQRGEAAGLNFALLLLAELDEPEKPVVPQFVADWYEDNQDDDDFEFNLYRLCGDYDNCELDKKMTIWFGNGDNKPFVTLVKMKLFGYEVEKEKEKEKLYLASFRDTNQYLGWNDKLGEWFISCSPFMSGVEQTRKTWEDVRIWDNPAFEIKEVK